MNVNLIRDILLRLESAASGSGADSLRFTDHEQALVSEHLQLLIQAGLIEDAESGGNRLTAKGREFLRMAKNGVLWKRVLGELSGSGRTLTLDALNARMLEWSFMS